MEWEAVEPSFTKCRNSSLCNVIRTQLKTSSSMIIIGKKDTYRLPAMALLERIWVFNIAISPKKSPLNQFRGLKIMKLSPRYLCKVVSMIGFVTLRTRSSHSLIPTGHLNEVSHQFHTSNIPIPILANNNKFFKDIYISFDNNKQIIWRIPLDFLQRKFWIERQKLPDEIYNFQHQKSCAHMSYKPFQSFLLAKTWKVCIATEL